MFTTLLWSGLLAQPGEVESALAKIAGGLHSFQGQEFIYRTEPWRLPKSWLASWQKGAAALLSRDWPTKDVLPLLEHKDARLRLLALAALFDKQDPALIRHFVDHLQDEGRHFPEFRVLRAIAQLPNNPRNEDEDRPDPQDVHSPTVADFAKSCLRFWLEPAGHDLRQVNAYLAESSKFDFRSSWYSAKARRVTSQTSASPKFYDLRKPYYDAFRKELDALPKERRDWVLLWVVSQNEYGPTKLEEFLGGKQRIEEAGKLLGPDYLRKLLRHEPIPGDADLQDDQRCRRLRWPTIRYVLKHAPVWLEPKDAGELKRNYEGTPRQVEWLLAAAALRPGSAAAWLKEAIKGHQADKNQIHESWLRAELAAGLARLAGADEAAYVTEWYFGEFIPKDRLTYSTSRQIFMDALMAEPTAQSGKVLAALIGDRRFATDTPPTLIWQVALTVNEHAGREVVLRKHVSFGFDLRNEHDRKRLARVHAALAAWAKGDS